MQYFGAALSFISSGLQYFNSMDQAKQAQNIANLNLQASMQASQNQYDLAQLQFTTNQRLAAAQAAQGQANAASLAAQADATDKNARADAQRTRLDYERMKAIQRGRMAKGGVLEAGTPLDTMAETAGQMALAIANQNYESSIASSKQRYEAEGEKVNASLTQLGGAIQGFRDQASMADAQNRMVTARIENLVATNRAKQMKQEAFATLIGAAGSSMSSYGSSSGSGSYGSVK
ncbi:hypothetical protein [Prosthecobacter sp.]|jgi:hypothetical protein|uniref:hypothetical protein n=1 Tax=Prosthecobacter sp. TaxID=1965333 RepID=UPI0037CA33B9